MSLPWRAFCLAHDSIAMERLEGETIIIDFRTGCYHSTVGTGADILWLVEHRVDCAIWGDALGFAYEDLDWTAATEGVVAFLEQLQSLELVLAIDDGIRPAPAFPDDVTRQAWVTPLLTVNEELSDLLVIDPVHDVSGDGWPSTT